MNVEGAPVVGKDKETGEREEEGEEGRKEGYGDQKALKEDKVDLNDEEHPTGHDAALSLALHIDEPTSTPAASAATQSPAGIALPASATPASTSPSPRSSVPLPAMPKRAAPPRRKMPTPKPSGDSVPKVASPEAIDSATIGQLGEETPEPAGESVLIQEENPAEPEPTPAPEEAFAHPLEEELPVEAVDDALEHVEEEATEHKEDPDVHQDDAHPTREESTSHQHLTKGAATGGEVSE